ncbi:gag-protease polyprotein [Cucumis melo var. makuwa]|uniref:Gag-protease polyprotein n=1 Tax=Cucumis melo var. makuwa TaxID=1194695 RepID=A0A5A7T1Y8_CUCMM|nr:gag-protease polyprotein [Cucumis melo var. makuwa]
MLDVRYSVVMLMCYVVDWNCMSMDLEVTVRYVVVIGLDIDHGVWTGKDSKGTARGRPTRGRKDAWYNPTTFDGSLKDPTRAQLWLSSLETIFRYMKCPEDQKVQCAVFMLTDRGTAWWETTERMLGGDVSQITWQQFKESFYAKFFSASLRDAKRQEFLNLEQGDMTVE